MDSMTWVGATAKQISRAVRRGDATATQVVADHLEQIAISDPALGAFRVVRGVEAITEAADAAHTRDFEDAQFGEASADAIVDCEYYDELAAAWSLVAAEHQLITPEILIAHDGSVH